MDQVIYTYRQQVLVPSWEADREPVIARGGIEPGTLSMPALCYSLWWLDGPPGIDLFLYT